jgi:hypothetical protein
VPTYLFEYEPNTDGRIKTIYKDGKSLKKSVRLEMPQNIVQTYFTSAAVNLSEMTTDPEHRQRNRHYGLQAFLMSLVGLEAFLNVHFHMLGREMNLPRVVEAVTTGNGTVQSKIKNPSHACYGTHIPGQRTINKRIRELYNLRSDIVHPKGEPSRIGMPGLIIQGESDKLRLARVTNTYGRRS